MRTPSTHATVHLIDTDPCIRCRVCGDKAKPDDDFVSLDIADAGVLANPRHLRKIRDVIDRWLASPDGVRLTAIETAKLAAMGGVVTPPDGWTRDERGNLRGPRGTTIFRKRSDCPKHAIAFNPSDPAWQPGADYPTESAALEAARAILTETAEAVNIYDKANGRVDTTHSRRHVFTDDADQLDYLDLMSIAFGADATVREMGADEHPEAV